MNPSTEIAPDGAGHENQPAVNLSRLVDEFKEQEEEGAPGHVSSGPVYRSRPTNLRSGIRSGNAVGSQSGRKQGSHRAQGSWGGRILVAMVWLVTLGTGAGMAAYHYNPGFRARFNQFAQQYLPLGGMSLTDKLAEPYKESMAKIESRGLSLEEASKAMGADPGKQATAEENARFEANLAAMSGEESNVAVARNRRLQEKFGGAGTLDLSKERDALAQQKPEETKPAAKE